MSSLSLLKEAGYKLTPARKKILESIQLTPLSAQDLFEVLKQKNIHIDLVTVYRTLELFVKLGIVQRIQLGDVTVRYERIDDNNHHHHLICNQCGTVKDIPLNEKSLLHQVEKQTDFKVSSHSLEFFGLCSQCQ